MMEPVSTTTVTATPISSDDVPTPATTSQPARTSVWSGSIEGPMMKQLKTGGVAKREPINQTLVTAAL